MLKPPPTDDLTLLPTGRFKETWVFWFDRVYKALSGQTPAKLPEYTVSTLPSAGNIELVYVSDEAGGATIAFSDGTNWRRVQDRAIVS